MPTYDSDRPMSVHGVPGRLTHRTTKPDGKAGLWFKQRWISERRPVRGYDDGATLSVTLRYDDELGNGHNSFAMTGDIRGPRNRDIAGGMLHDDIAVVFPELAALARWHLVSADGPMHYLANIVFHAGDRDHYGLRKGEVQEFSTRSGQPMWELVAVNSFGVSISGTETGLKYTGAETVPLFILTKSWTGDTPPATPRLEWRRATRTGEGKKRELDHARSSACWPDATDEQLSAEPAELRAMLTARLPTVLEEFRAAIEGTGFLWEPPAAS